MIDLMERFGLLVAVFLAGMFWSAVALAVGLVVGKAARGGGDGE